MNEDEYRVYFVNFPATIRAACRIDETGFPSIYINDALSPQAKRAAFMHEIKHIRKNDHYNSKTIQQVENAAQT